MLEIADGKGLMYGAISPPCSSRPLDLVIVVDEDLGVIMRDEICRFNRLCGSGQGIREIVPRERSSYSLVVHE